MAQKRLHARSYFSHAPNPNIGQRVVKPPSTAKSWNIKGIEYRQLEKDFSSDELFDFNKKHGSTPHNFIPDGPVRDHLAKIATGETTVWGAFDGKQLVGFLSAASNGGYWLNTGAGENATSFVNEFVVDASQRGKGIGKNLTKMSVDANVGIFGVNPAVKEMYTTVHADNVGSRTAFLASGYEETITYADKARDRNTTVMKKACLMTSVHAAQIKGVTRVVGLQSGNAVDGIDVGVFEFEPVVRSSTDPRVLAAPLKYKTIANKTFSFTPEQRQYVLGLRALDRTDGVEYGEGNYKMGEWFGDCVNALLTTENIDPDSIDLIGSHGQSICGHPHWEIGDIAVIAQRTGITTAGDFRPTDVAAGGNGTPCTCTYDTIFLRPDAGTEKWRITINIGGTSSVTFCPPWPTEAEGVGETPLGLDPGPGVFFMDLITAIIDPSLEFDEDGKLARSGTVHEGLLEEFANYRYFQQETLPIGVGAEDFPEKLFESWHARAKELGVSDIDLLSTFTEWTAKMIASACAKHGGPKIINGATDDVILRGGVSNNTYFCERLKAQLSMQLNTEIPRLKTLEDVGLSEHSWENAMYAMFGYLCFNNIYSFVPSCTGAVRPVVSGKVAPGDNFHSIKLIR
jgi:anhydro-N-acetylmuramic acid kinase